ncbi:MAG TPA: high-potential iron sulfur protein 2 [Alteromonas australica]|uniref:High-potential iron sulfur protein 2 n=1 Tax=Alteromonas australica TaxID=589873 RepID=A0A075PAY5_9ALTE|nr:MULTISPECIES: high-potential iron-sulfur protein [Alteromonas]MAB93532.1 high-potential iron sulfur protein 2 [Alteromonas sp.]HBO00052.1 high-potential iron sulfur protein 2 [Alteromonas macleodii]AIG00503.1 high-potential iron sulfur protein 2 [Alteromonas australica]AJP45389.1 high-potential iron sulfur protein 2 [Alteromonas australica]MAF72015.1 high-potential iron sulfur protein 2 [Alteromonas sp.]|tara:strand:- start:231 stop:524 length:294 start_codon:yes stop_codon:yes gene_type:complete
MKSVNRRDFLKLSGTSLIGLTLGSVALRAQAQEQLQADDPTAKALNYTPASTVDGAQCKNCMYVQGADGENYRPCALFPNKLVNANGWCSAWVKRPS